VSFLCLASTCLNFTRTRTQVVLKDELKNEARARAHNKSSRTEPVCELALIFYFIYFFINLIFSL
jgi:hypothetical protein